MIKKRIEVLINIKFFINLEILKHYFKLTKWIKIKIAYYAQKTKPFQREKIFLLKKSFIIEEQK